MLPSPFPKDILWKTELTLCVWLGCSNLYLPLSATTSIYGGRNHGICVTMKKSGPDESLAQELATLSLFYHTGSALS